MPFEANGKNIPQRRNNNNNNAGGQRQRPIIIGDIENEEERRMLENQLAGQGMTLADVEVLTIPQCRARGLENNEQFMAMVRAFGYNSLDEMEVVANRMRANGQIGQVGGNG